MTIHIPHWLLWLLPIAVFWIAGLFFPKRRGDYDFTPQLYGAACLIALVAVYLGMALGWALS